MFQLIARTIFPLALLASLVGCAAEDCPPIPDGYYQASPTTPGYTFQDGLPLAFASWSCPATEAACTTTYQCDGAEGEHETVTVTSVRPGVIELTIGDTETQTLYAAGSW